MPSSTTTESYDLGDNRTMIDDDPTFVLLRGAVLSAVDELFALDEEILGTTERVVVGRLANYLDARLTGLAEQRYALDQEYERVGLVGKRFDGKGEIKDRKFVPDLIVHRRLRNGQHDNLLVMEVKTDAQGDRLHDFAKLSVLTGHADSAVAYTRSLRIDGEDPPRGQQKRGKVWRPAGMNYPYRFGLWLLVLRDRVEFWWWLGGPGPAAT